MFRSALATRSVVVVVTLLASLVVTAGTPTPVAAAEVRPITHPVHPDHLGKVHWTDTFGAPRSGGRSHIGVDIMGPKMVPLVAAVNGTVTWIRHDSVRGNNLEITDADGWRYHYVHINNDTPGTDDGANLYELAFGPGIARGVQVRAGQVVAYLGDSGNAESTAPHLHFEILRPDGSAINPTPSVDAAAAHLRAVPALTAAQVRPWASPNELLADLFTTLTGRPGTTAEMASFARVVSEQGLAAALTPYLDSSSRAAAVDRLYVAFFLRAPDLGGYRYWIGRTDLSNRQMADFFAGSPEYQTRYGNLDFGVFLDQLYRNVLGRAPDEGGKAYWLARLADPNDVVTKGSIVAFFTDSDELRSVTAHRSEIVALMALLHNRTPTQAEMASWRQARTSMSLAVAVQTIYLGG
jgi:hypothetical protein